MAQVQVQVRNVPFNNDALILQNAHAPFNPHARTIPNGPTLALPTRALRSHQIARALDGEGLLRMDDGRAFVVGSVIGSGAETTCYAHGTGQVLLVTSSGSADKDVLVLMTLLRDPHTLATSFIGYLQDGRKVYRQTRLPYGCIGKDDDGIAYTIRARFPYRYDTDRSAYVRELLRLRAEIPHSVVRSLVRMVNLYKRHGFDVREGGIGLDLHCGNYATLPDGTFVLVDPFYRG